LGVVGRNIFSVDLLGGIFSVLLGSGGVDSGKGGVTRFVDNAGGDDVGGDGSGDVGLVGSGDVGLIGNGDVGLTGSGDVGLVSFGDDVGIGGSDGRGSEGRKKLLNGGGSEGAGCLLKLDSKVFVGDGDIALSESTGR